MKQSEAIQRVVDVCRLRHLSLATERSYCGWVARYGEWLGRFGRGLQTPEERMKGFLTALAKRDVAAATQHQAFNALRFLYVEAMGIPLGNVDALRAKRPQHLRHSPSVEEIRALFAHVRDVHGYPTGLIVRLIYGCGLRVKEPLNIRFRDIDLAQRRFIIRGAKGGKDRVAMIPASLVDQFAKQMDVGERVAELDGARGLPVALPGLLAVKYPRYAFARGWGWLFPSHRPCMHPRTGQAVRWRVHEANVQKCVRDAARAAGIEGHVTPHHLRHGFATHAIDRGASIRDVQEALGHKSLETTMIYVHPEVARIESPLDRIAAA
jgi:site-specific recombinase XerD